MAIDKNTVEIFKAFHPKGRALAAKGEVDDLERIAGKSQGDVLRLLADQADEIAVLREQVAEHAKRLAEAEMTSAAGQSSQSDAIVAALGELKAALKFPEPPKPAAPLDLGPVVQAINELKAVLLAPVELETGKDGAKRARRKMEK